MLARTTTSHNVAHVSLDRNTLLGNNTVNESWKSPTCPPFFSLTRTRKLKVPEGLWWCLRFLLLTVAHWQMCTAWFTVMRKHGLLLGFQIGYCADWLVQGRHTLCEIGGRPRWKKKDESVSVKSKELGNVGIEGEVRIKKEKESKSAEALMKELSCS